MDDAVNPYQPPDQDFAAPSPKSGEGPIVLRGPYDPDELDYESPEVENSVFSSVCAVVTVLTLMTGALAPGGQHLLFVAPVFALGWIAALWVERTEQRAAEARFSDQRLDMMEQIVVDEAGVSVTIEGEVAVTPWDRLESALEEPGRDRLILSGPSWFWLPLPRRRLANEGDWERLVRLVRSKLPEPSVEEPAKEMTAPESHPPAKDSA